MANAKGQRHRDNQRVRPKPTALRFGAAGSICAAIATMAASASAQEIQLTGPLCGAPAVRRALVGRTAWTTWLSGGASWAAGDEVRPSLNVGSEMTFRLLQAVTYPSPLELRWGPWAQIGTDFVGTRGEGGVVIALSDVLGMPVGSAGLRLGGGTGDDAFGKQPHLVGLLFIGGRSAYHSAYGNAGQPCDKLERGALEAGARVFIGLRRTLEAMPRTWATVGAEFDLTHLF
jgi:hypothetical protein